MAGQTNNFYGPVGAAGISDSSVHIDMTGSRQKKKLVVVAREIAKILDSIEKKQVEQHLIPAIACEIQLATTNYPQLCDPKFIENSINSDPTLKQRVLAASSAASLKALKMLFPPLAVAIEAVRAFRASGSNSAY
jgi:hypothetical protein